MGPVRSAGGDESFVRVARGFPVSRSVPAMSESVRRERQLLYNSLAIVLKAVEKHRTTVDLRNEATVVGVVDHADA